MTDANSHPGIAAALRCFVETRNRVEVTYPTAGFSGAVIVRVETSVGAYCLRGWPRNALPEQRIRGLHRLMRHIDQQGVDCVAVPLQGVAGESLIQQHGRSWQLEPWLPGIADFWTNSNTNRLCAAARALARWHRAASSFLPDAREASWFSCQSQVPSPAVHERLERLRRLRRRGLAQIQASRPESGPSDFDDIGRHIVELFLRVADRVEEELVIAGRLRFDLQPCLRDVWHDHVLFTGDDVTGLIDANACRYENVATDLARLFGSLVEDHTQSWDMALDEYQQHARLSVDELALVQVLDRSTVLMSGTTWLSRAYIEGQPVTQDARVIARMRTIARRLERLT